MKSVMEGAYQLDAALKVDAEVGPNWYEMEKVVNDHSAVCTVYTSIAQCYART